MKMSHKARFLSPFITEQSLQVHEGLELRIYVPHSLF